MHNAAKLSGGIQCAANLDSDASHSCAAERSRVAQPGCEPRSSALRYKRCHLHQRRPRSRRRCSASSFYPGEQDHPAEFGMRGEFASHDRRSGVFGVASHQVVNDLLQAIVSISAAAALLEPGSTNKLCARAIRPLAVAPGRWWRLRREPASAKASPFRFIKN